MSVTVAQLRAGVGVDASALDSGLRGAERAVDASGRRMEGQAKRISAKLTAALGGGLGRNTLGQFTKGAGGGALLGGLSEQVSGITSKLSGAFASLIGGAVRLAASLAGTLFSAVTSLLGGVLRLAAALGTALVNAVSAATRAVGGVLVGALNSAIAAARTLALVAGGALVAGLALLGRQGVIVNQTLQGVQMGLTALLRSAPMAERLMNALRSESVTSAFEFVDLAGWSKRLLAMGFGVNAVIPTIRALGDAVAGLGGGKEVLDRLVLGLGQMLAKTKVSAEEMMQLTEAGIPAWQFLSQAIGKTTAEVMKLAEQGAISAQTGIGAIVAGIQQRFGGMQQMMTQTLPGVISNLKDVFNELSASVTTGLYQRLINAGQGLQKFLGSLNQTAGGKAILRALWQLFDRVGQAAEALVARLPVLTQWLAKLLDSGKLTTWKGAFLDAFGRAWEFVKSAIEWIGTHWEALWEGAKQTVNSAVRFFGGIFAGLAEAWGLLGRHGAQVWDHLSNRVQLFGVTLVRHLVFGARAILRYLIQPLISAKMLIEAVAAGWDARGQGWEGMKRAAWHATADSRTQYQDSIEADRGMLGMRNWAVAQQERLRRAMQYEQPLGVNAQGLLDAFKFGRDRWRGEWDRKGSDGAETRKSALAELLETLGGPRAQQQEQAPGSAGSGGYFGALGNAGTLGNAAQTLADLGQQTAKNLSDTLRRGIPAGTLSNNDIEGMREARGFSGGTVTAGGWTYPVAPAAPFPPASPLRQAAVQVVLNIGTMGMDPHEVGQQVEQALRQQMQQMFPAPSY